MDVIEAFIFYTNMFRYSFITFLDIVGTFMKNYAISGHFHAAYTVQCTISNYRTRVHAVAKFQNASPMGGSKANAVTHTS